MSTLVLRGGRLRPTVPLALVALLLAVVTAALVIGRYPLSVGQVADVLSAQLTGAGAATDPTTHAVVLGLRLPRIVLAAVAGTGLALAGAAFQGLFANPLATPDTLGVTAGASVGAVVGLLLSLPMMGVQLLSLVAGVATVLLTTLVARHRGRSSTVMLILSGVVVAAIANAVLSILKYTADPNDKLPQITYWLMGSLSGANLTMLAVGVPLVAAGSLVVVLLRWRLDVVALGEDEARAAGMDVRRVRWVVVLAATLVTASCVSMCGQVGWVGLLVPHCARMLCGGSYRFVVPVSALLGASFLVVIDTLARSVTASELPISVLTAVVGAPFFVVLLRRTGGAWT